MHIRARRGALEAYKNKNYVIAVGSVVNLLIHPVGALIIGSFAGALSVIGYRYLSVIFLPLLLFNYCCNLLQLIFLPFSLSLAHILA
jgi:ammonium transporter Rh